MQSSKLRCSIDFQVYGFRGEGRQGHQLISWEMQHVPNPPTLKLQIIIHPESPPANLLHNLIHRAAKTSLRIAPRQRSEEIHCPTAADAL